MSYPIFHFIHLASVFLLVGASVYAIAAAKDRKRVLMISGISSLLVVVTGFGLLGILKAGMPGWSMIKTLVWLLVSASAGLAYRLPDRRKHLMITTMCLVLLALAMVSFKP